METNNKAAIFVLRKFNYDITQRIIYNDLLKDIYKSSDAINLDDVKKAIIQLFDEGMLIDFIGKYKQGYQLQPNDKIIITQKGINYLREIELNNALLVLAQSSIANKTAIKINKITITVLTAIGTIFVGFQVFYSCQQTVIQQKQYLLQVKTDSILSIRHSDTEQVYILNPIEKK